MTAATSFWDMQTRDSVLGEQEMKKLLLTLLLALCISASSFAYGKLPKLLIDGCFFDEMPAEVDGKQVGVIILSDQDGNKIMAIKGVKLSDESKRYAVKKEGRS